MDLRPMIIPARALRVVPRSHQWKEWRVEVLSDAPAKNRLFNHLFRRLPTFRLLALLCNLPVPGFLNGIDLRPSTNLLLQVHTLLLLPRTRLLPKPQGKQCHLRLLQQTQSISRQKRLQNSRGSQRRLLSLLSSGLRHLLLLLAHRRVSWLHSLVLPTWIHN